jgi:hypothetical protein
MDAWKSYMMEVLKKFKSADKSNWHHRMGVKVCLPLPAVLSSSKN